jgi:hypothetical protein
MSLSLDGITSMSNITSISSIADPCKLLTAARPACCSARRTKGTLIG